MPGARPDWKSYRLKPNTVLLFRAVRTALARTYLTHDELLVAALLNFLLRRRALRDHVDALLQKDGLSLADFEDVGRPGHAPT